MKKDDDLLFALGRGDKLTMERVANLLIPLMGAIYAKQQLSLQQENPIGLSEAFRAVVRDIFALSSEVVALEKELDKRKKNDDGEIIN